MAMNNTNEQRPPKPVLQKPPGYRDPSGLPTTKPAPIRKPSQLPPSFQKVSKQAKRRRSCCRICCCCLCITLLVVLFLLAVLGGALYLWLTPKLPVFHLQSFNLTAFNVTRRPDGSYLGALTSLRLEAKNPNHKLTYRYGDSDVHVTAGVEGSADETDLGSTTLSGFAQEMNNVTSLRIQTRVKDQLVDDGVGKTIMDRFKAGSLTVNVEVKTSIGLGVGGIKIGMLRANVQCRGMVLRRLEGGEMPSCSINALKWINIH